MCYTHGLSILVIYHYLRVCSGPHLVVVRIVDMNLRVIPRLRVNPLFLVPSHNAKKGHQAVSPGSAFSEHVW
jgi:hypothetical protein